MLVVATLATVANEHTISVKNRKRTKRSNILDSTRMYVRTTIIKVGNASILLVVLDFARATGLGRV